MPRPRAGLARLLAVLFVVLVSFSLYRSTLLPGLDLGDTASLQATIGSPIITPRDGYPLYFAIGNLAFLFAGGDAAHVLNLVSAIEAAVACGLIAIVAMELSGSLLSGAAAALLFAVSYTFWSQAVIAEVYALHMLFTALTIWLLLRWADKPTMGRLACFFAAYALGFGNHLSMVLLAPGFTLFLLLRAPGGWRTMFTPRVIGLATALAVLGALQYLWNLRGLWLQPAPPPDLLTGLQQFWFDVTKSDWRETMVMRVPQVMLGDHASMYRFDVVQQFGWIGPVLAVVGLAQLARTNWTRAALLLLLYVVNVLFAFGYNVGDAHVFYLPSHLMLALLAAPALALIGEIARTPRLPALLCLGYAALRGWHDYPALDRSHDHRPTTVLAGLTAGLDDRRAILLTDLNWQLQNGLSYFAARTAPAVAYTRMPAVVLYAPALVADNRAIGRDVALTETARATLASAYGPLFPTVRDAGTPTVLLASATDIPSGSRYVLCVLKPTRDLQLDWPDIGRALTRLSGGEPVRVPDGDYLVVAGLQGQAPALIVGANRPFARSIDLAGVPVEIRMDSWLNADTIRRMGFGHVIVRRHHTLIVERGVSFAAFDESGTATKTAYASSLYASQSRYLVTR